MIGLLGRSQEHRRFDPTLVKIQQNPSDLCFIRLREIIRKWSILENFAQIPLTYTNFKYVFESQKSKSVQKLAKFAQIQLNLRNSDQSW